MTSLWPWLYFVFFLIAWVFWFITIPVGFLWFGSVTAFNILMAYAWSKHKDGAWFSIWLGETCAAFTVFFITMPLAWLITSLSVRGRSPVLLIHGYINNSGALWLLRWRLKMAGYGVHTINLKPLFGEMESYAEQVNKKLERICSQAGDKVSLVGHSMGGLVARATLRRYGNARINRIITIGTPHQGTINAKMAIGQSGRQMEPGNPWLKQLEIDEGRQWSCAAISIYSIHDNVITPPSYSELHDAKNIILRDVGHVSLPFSRQVFELIKTELDTPLATMPTV